MNNEIKEAKEYWENITAREGYRSPGFNIKDYYTLIHPELIDKYLQPSKQKILFEIGCGWGKQTKLFAKMFKNVIASDISRTILDIAKNRCSDYGNIVYCEYPNELKNVDIKADCLFCYGTLQYCTDHLILTMLNDIIPYIKHNAKFLLEFQMFDSERIEQKLIRKGRVDIMRNPHEIKTLLKETALIVEGYDLVIKPTLQVWVYGHIKQ